MKLSKSEIKRRFKRIEEVARELADFSNRDLNNLPGSDFFHEEIKNTRGLKGGARKRQIKYLAKVMRDEPIDEILNFLAADKGSKIQEKRMFHEAEHLRDAVINEAIQIRDDCLSEGEIWEMDWHSETIPAAVEKLPQLSEDAVRKSVYQYVKSRNAVHSRELFRMILSAIEYQHRVRLQANEETEA